MTAAPRLFATPLARRLAARAGIDLARLSGSGPHGRIIKADIDAALAAPRPAPPSAETPPPPAPAPVVPPVEYDVVPLTPMRRTIARRLTEAKTTIPHFYLSADVTMDAAIDLRAQLNQRLAPAKLSLNDLILRGLALALRAVPEANAAWAGEEIHRFHAIDVALAVATPGGLLTPVLRRVDRLGLSEIAATAQDLAARARAGKLMPEDYQGGGVTLSNLGMYGVGTFAAILNPPQACILAVGAAEPRPVVKDGGLAVATVMTATLSVDHRVVDGATAARLLAAFKAVIEDPLRMLL